MKSFLKDVTSFLISFGANIGFFLTSIGKIVTHPKAVFIIIGIWIIGVIIYIIYLLTFSNSKNKAKEAVIVVSGLFAAILTAIKFLND